MFARIFSAILNWLRLIGSPSHKRNIRKAKRALATLGGIEHEGAAINYLRKLDPYCFEELALCLFEQRGCVVLRSRSYSGDGGEDGRVRWPGVGWMPVQCKRYGKSIAPAHARAFAELCSRFKGGIFIHTGRTGDASQEALAGPGMLILSGSLLARAAKDPRFDLLGELARKKAAANARIKSQAGARTARPRKSPPPKPPAP